MKLTNLLLPSLVLSPFVSQIFQPSPFDYQPQAGENNEHHLDEKTISRLLKEKIFFWRKMNTPASLMLHSANADQIEEIAPILAEKYSGLSYREYYSRLALRGNFTNRKPPLLVSIDDLGITWLNPTYKKMINSMTKNGLVGTLGIVTEGKPDEIKTEIWEYLRSCQQSGWELAIHTHNHYHLPSLTDKELKYQIEESYHTIGSATGIYPSTLILPFGGVYQIQKQNSQKPAEFDQRIFSICKNLDIRWIVGIQNGKNFSGEPPFFVGRIPPDSQNGTITLQWLKNSFNKDNSVGNGLDQLINLFISR